MHILPTFSTACTTTACLQRPPPDLPPLLVHRRRAPGPCGPAAQQPQQARAGTKAGRNGSRGRSHVVVDGSGRPPPIVSRKETDRSGCRGRGRRPRPDQPSDLQDQPSHIRRSAAQPLGPGAAARHRAQHAGTSGRSHGGGGRQRRQADHRCRRPALVAVQAAAFALGVPPRLERVGCGAGGKAEVVGQGRVGLFAVGGGGTTGAERAGCGWRRPTSGPAAAVPAAAGGTAAVGRRRGRRCKRASTAAGARGAAAAHDANVAQALRPHVGGGRKPVPDAHRPAAELRHDGGAERRQHGSPAAAAA